MSIIISGKTFTQRDVVTGKLGAQFVIVNSQRRYLTPEHKRALARGPPPPPPPPPPQPPAAPTIRKRLEEARRRRRALMEEDEEVERPDDKHVERERPDDKHASFKTMVGYWIAAFFEHEVNYGALRNITRWVRLQGGEDVYEFAVHQRPGTRSIEYAELLRSPLQQPLTLVYRARLYFSEREAGVGATKQGAASTLISKWQAQNAKTEAAINALVKRDSTDYVAVAAETSRSLHYLREIEPLRPWVTREEQSRVSLLSQQVLLIRQASLHLAELRNHFDPNQRYALPMLEMQSPNPPWSVTREAAGQLDILVMHNSLSKTAFLFDMSGTMSEREMAYVVLNLEHFMKGAATVAFIDVGHFFYRAALLYTFLQHPYITSQRELVAKLIEQKNLSAERFANYIYAVLARAESARKEPFVNVPLAKTRTTKTELVSFKVLLYLEYLARIAKNGEICLRSLGGAFEVTVNSRPEDVTNELLAKIATCPFRYILSDFAIQYVTADPTQGAHLNGLLVDTKERRVIRLEPNDIPTDFVDVFLEMVLVPKLSAYVGGTPYRYENASSSCPNIARAQSIQKIFSTTGGYCVAWSALWLALIVLNPTWTLADIQRRILQGGTAATAVFNRGELLLDYIQRFIDGMDCVIPDLPPPGTLANYSLDSFYVAVRRKLGLSPQPRPPGTLGRIAEMWIRPFGTSGSYILVAVRNDDGNYFTWSGASLSLNPAHSREAIKSGAHIVKTGSGDILRTATRLDAATVTPEPLWDFIYRGALLEYLRPYLARDLSRDCPLPTRER